MATDEQALLNQLLGNTPRKASLMQPPAGNSYFSNQSNIPPMVGNFYVGSPTEVISDFVPLPLDFLKQDVDNKQTHFDNTRANVNALEGAIREQLKATQYNEDYKEQILQKYGISENSQQWAKQLLANPLKAGQVAQELIALKSKLDGDTGVQRLKEEHDAWTQEQNSENILSSGWANFIDPTTGQIKQLDPTKTKGQWTNDDHMKYYKENYAPKLTASLKETLEKGGFDTRMNEYGMIEYKTPGSSTWEAIDPNNPKNPSYKYVREAIKNVGMEMYADPNLQVSGIMRDRMGFGDDVNRYIDFVYRMASPQFYNKETVDPGSLEMKTPPKDGGGTPGPNGMILPTKDDLQVYAGAANIVNNGKTSDENITTLRTHINQLENSIRRKVLDRFAKNIGTDKLEYLEDVLINGTNGNNGLNHIMDELATKYPDNPLLKSGDWVGIVTALNGKSNNELKREWGSDIYNKVNNVITQGLLQALSNGDNENQILLDELSEDLSLLDRSKNELEYLNLYKDQAIKQSFEQAGINFKEGDVEEYSSTLRFLEENNYYRYDWLNKSNEYIENEIFGYDSRASQHQWFNKENGELIRTEKELLSHLEKNRPDLYEGYKKGIFKTVAHIDKRDSYAGLALSDKAKDNLSKFKKVEKTAAWKNYTAGKMAINTSIVTHNDTESGKATKTATLKKSLETLYKGNPASALSHIQRAAGGDGHSDLNDTEILKILGSVNDKFTSLEGLAVTGVNIIDVPNYGLPRIQVTYQNKAGSIANVDFQLPKDDANGDILKIVGELLSEDDSNERELGYKWYADLSIEDKDKFKINSFFNPDFSPSDELNVPITVGPHQYYLYSSGKGDKQLRYLNPTTDTYEPLIDRGNDAQGKKITNTNIKNSVEATKLIGLNLFKKAEALLKGGAQGGSTQPGKSPIQKGKLWSPQ